MRRAGMAESAPQGDLFAAGPALPEGFLYRDDFVTREAEAALVASIAGLPLRPARYKSYEARRLTLTFGFAYDYSENRLDAAPPLPPFLLPLRERVASWLELDATLFEQALLTEYPPRTPIGWHRDTPDFEVVAGVSLVGACRMRFRPYPHVAHVNAGSVEIRLEPRSVYAMRGIARWQWQHHIPPTDEHRYSITFRTRSTRKARTAGGRRSERTI